MNRQKDQDPVASLRSELEGMDIYLLDQLLRGRIKRTTRILDAGCGGGRNLRWFLTHGFDVYGVDEAPEAVAATRQMALDAGMERSKVSTRFKVAPLEAPLPFPTKHFDLVICNAVLHFARSAECWHQIVERIFEHTAPGGMVFVRTATSHGLTTRISPLPDAPPGWFHLPDGSQRFLVRVEDLTRKTGELGARLADPIKSVDVQGLRVMTTWTFVRPENNADNDGDRPLRFPE